MRWRVVSEVVYSDTAYVPRSVLWEGIAHLIGFLLMDAMPTQYEY